MIWDKKFFVLLMITILCTSLCVSERKTNQDAYHSFIRLSTHSFLESSFQQIFTEHLLCALPNFKHWGTRGSLHGLEKSVLFLHSMRERMHILATGRESFLCIS